MAASFGVREPQSARTDNLEPAQGQPNASASTQRVVYAAREHETVEVPLGQLLVGNALDLYPEIVRKGLFTVLFARGRVALQARGFVGLVPVNDRVAIDVSPRVPVANLGHILGVAEHTLLPLARYLRGYSTDSFPLPSVVDLFADALVDAVDVIQSRGLHHEYANITQATSFPRGRILLGETIKRTYSRGARHHVCAAWFQRSADSAVNRCIKYAIWYLAQKYLLMQPRTGSRSRTFRLNQAYHLFRLAELDLSKSFLDNPLVSAPTRLQAIHSHYADALQLAKAVIRERGVSFADCESDVRLASLLIKMDDVFEAYLRNSLQKRMVEAEATLRVLNGNRSGPSGGALPLFDNFDEPVANPDIVVCRDPSDMRQGTAVLIEVKYKKRQAPEREDINQALAYGAAYRCPTVVIVLPRYEDCPRGLRELGQVGNSLTLYQYHYDLAAARLADEEIAFARSIRELATRCAC